MRQRKRLCLALWMVAEHFELLAPLAEQPEQFYALIAVHVASRGHQDGINFVFFFHGVYRLGVRSFISR